MTATAPGVLWDPNILGARIKFQLDVTKLAGLPNNTHVQTLVDGAGGNVMTVVGPGGMYRTDLFAGGTPSASTCGTAARLRRSTRPAPLPRS